MKIFKSRLHFYKRWGHRSKNFGGRKSTLDNLLHCRWSIVWKGEHRGRCLQINLGPGNGYIGGAHFYLAINCKGTQGVEMYRAQPLQLGFHFGPLRFRSRVPFSYGM